MNNCRPYYKLENMSFQQTNKSSFYLGIFFRNMKQMLLAANAQISLVNYIYGNIFIFRQFVTLDFQGPDTTEKSELTLHSFLTRVKTLY